MKAHELLSDASKWTKGTCARDAKNDHCRITSAEATKFCILGAIGRCYSIKDDAQAKAIAKLETKLLLPSIWNDAPERTFEEVHNLLKELDI